MKILLVEDSATLRFAMRNYITEFGHTALMAKSGEEALQLLEATPVDMIIMDVEMPGLDGFETTRLIREWLGEYWLPIVFVTGRDEDESYQEGIEAGGDDYLIKPVSATILKAKIRAFERITEMRDQLNRLNAELESLTQLDNLTQTYNRRTFNEMATQQWQLATRHKHPISLLIIDIDHFKLYNEHYGNPAGDLCLKKITQTIDDCLHRPYDLLGRYGGDEFIVLLQEADCAGALRVAQSIQGALDKLALRHEVSSTYHNVTVSIGGISSMRTTNQSLEDFIKQADRALYKAKRSGRNRILIDDVAIHNSILIVHHDLNYAHSLAATLNPHYSTLISDSSKEAFDICVAIHPDAIIMGADIADENNEQLCRQLARNTRSSNIPILLISEKSCHNRPISDASIGIQGCIETPLITGELLQRIQQLIV